MSLKLPRILPVVLAALCLPLPAWAGTQTLVYEVYAGGVHALQATLNLETGGGRYDVVLEARTQGLLGKLAPWEGIFESHGWIEKNGLYRPEIHQSTAIWRGKEEIKTYKYDRKGRFLGLTETLAGKPPEEKSDVNPELTEGTTDVLSAALNVLEQVGKGGECSGTEEVFDGKRRFRQVFAPQGTAELEATRYNIFNGPAAECTVEVKPVAGAWHKKPRGWMSIQEQGRLRGTMPTLWAAPLENGEPAVPVKIRVKTAYGTLFMHVVEYRDNKRTVVADSWKKE